MDIVEIVNKILSVLTVAAELFLVIGLVYLLAVRRDRGNRFRKFLARRAIVLSFLVALVATVGSLFYSGVAGYPPCELCWYQRIAMYPLVILLGIALFKKDDQIIDYALGLLGIGALISLYHNYLYFGNSVFAVCSAGGAACLARFVFEFNYVTIPVMALSAFLLMIFLLLVRRQAK